MSDGVTGYSELTTLAVCEARWAYRYRDDDEQTAGGARYLGTQLHDLCGSFWIGGDAQARAEATLAELAHAGWEDAARAAWIYDRYTSHYGKDRADGTLRVVATELQLQCQLPGSDVTIGTRGVDQIVFIKGAGLWAVERKSMADWSRLETLEVDPQVSIYLWLLKQNGWPVRGLLYDAIRTYQWVPTQPTQKALKELHPKNVRELGPEYTERIKAIQALPENQIERPLEDSFRQEWLDRSPYHEAEALADVQAAVARRDELVAGQRPIRNIGMNCRRCDHKVRCWSEMGFAQEFELAEDAYDEQ